MLNYRELSEIYLNLRVSLVFINTCKCRCVFTTFMSLGCADTLSLGKKNEVFKIIANVFFTFSGAVHTT